MHHNRCDPWARFEYEVASESILAAVVVVLTIVTKLPSFIVLMGTIHLPYGYLIIVLGP